MPLPVLLSAIANRLRLRTRPGNYADAALEVKKRERHAARMARNNANRPKLRPNSIDDLLASFPTNRANKPAPLSPLAELQNQASTLRIEAAAARREKMATEASIDNLKRRKEQNQAKAFEMVAAMGFDLAPTKVSIRQPSNAAQDATEATDADDPASLPEQTGPADFAAFAQEYRHKLQNEGADIAAAYYSKHGPQFGF